MSDSREDALTSPEPTERRRVPTLHRRLGNAVLGMVSGGIAGWLTALLAGVAVGWQWWIVAGLAALGAAFGYRYGRSVVGATVKAFIDGV